MEGEKHVCEGEMNARLEFALQVPLIPSQPPSRAGPSVLIPLWSIPGWPDRKVPVGKVIQMG